MKELLSTIVAEFGKALAQQLLKTTEQVQVVNEQVVSKETLVVDIAKTQKVIAKFTREDYEKLKPYLLNHKDKTYEEVLMMEQLYLGGTFIKDISCLKNLFNLKELYLDSNGITNITLLKDLVNLKKLNLYQNNISDIKPLQKLVNLEELRLSCNPISDITPLKNLVNLKELTLRAIKIPQKQIDELQKCLPKCKIGY